MMGRCWGKGCKYVLVGIMLVLIGLAGAYIEHTANEWQQAVTEYQSKQEVAR